MVRRALNLTRVFTLAIFSSFASLPLLAASFSQNSPGEARDYFAKSGLFATPPVKIISNNGINDISRSLNFSLNYFFRTVEKKKLFSLKKFNLALVTSRLLIK